MSLRVLVRRNTQASVGSNAEYLTLTRTAAGAFRRIARFGWRLRSLIVFNLDRVPTGASSTIVVGCCVVADE